MPHSVASEGSSASHKDVEALPDAPPATDGPNGAEKDEGAAAGKSTAGVKLEDIFDDDEDEETEFPASSVPAETKVESAE
jgi:DNA primase small subunit